MTTLAVYCLILFYNMSRLLYFHVLNLPPVYTLGGDISWVFFVFSFLTCCTFIICLITNQILCLIHFRVILYYQAAAIIILILLIEKISSEKLLNFPTHTSISELIPFNLWERKRGRQRLVIKDYT